MGGTRLQPGTGALSQPRAQPWVCGAMMSEAPKGCAKRRDHRARSISPPLQGCRCHFPRYPGLRPYSSYVPAGLSKRRRFGFYPAWNRRRLRLETCRAKFGSCAGIESADCQRHAAPRYELLTRSVSRFSPDLRTRRCAWTSDECSDDGDHASTIRVSLGPSQRVGEGLLCSFFAET